MRKAFFLVVAVVACAKTETPAADTAATAPPPPPPPAALTVADVSGTWNGASKREGSDSATTWTVTATSDSTGKLVFAGRKDSVAYTVKLDADSMMVSSVAYKDPAMPKNAPPVMFRGVGRLKDGKLVGGTSIVLASKPDSLVARTTWEATKAP